MKYSLLSILIATAAFSHPINIKPYRAQAKAEFSQEIGLAIRKTINVEEKDWDNIVSEQLKRRDIQIAEKKALEKARLEAVEVAKKAEEARMAQIPKPALKVANLTSKTSNTVGSNYYMKGSCAWYVASRRAVGAWGNANQWLGNARAAGWATGSVPRVGAIAWTGAGPLGHVAIVEAVNGNQVTVQDANYAGLGVITTRLTSASEWGGFIY